MDEFWYVVLACITIVAVYLIHAWIVASKELTYRREMILAGQRGNVSGDIGGSQGITGNSFFDGLLNKAMEKGMDKMLENVQEKK